MNMLLCEPQNKHNIGCIIKNC